MYSVKTNIVIVAYNQLEYCKRCVESIKKNTNLTEYELYLVDNGSTDGVNKYFDSIKEAKVFHSSKNLGFSAGNNLALKEITSGNVVLLNSDTIVSNGWLSNLNNIIKKDKTIGLVGPVTNNAPGIQQIKISLFNDVANIENINNFSKTIFNKNISFTDRLVGYCLFISEEAFLNIGLLDERFNIGNWEDDDYSRRAKLFGYKLAIANNTFVYHYGGKTFDVLGLNKSKLNENFQKNKKEYDDKWRGLDILLSIPKDVVHSVDRNNLISVIIPCFNYGQYLDECINSVLNQTYGNFEILIGDDCSTDNSRKIIEKQKKKSFRIRTFYNSKNLGVGRTRNLLIELARGKYILPLDADDMINEKCLEKMINTLNSNPNISIAYSYYIDLFDTGGILKKPIEYSFDSLKNSNFMVCTSMYYKEHWNKVRGYNETLTAYEDWDFWLKMGINGYFGKLIKEPLFIYRQTKNSRNKKASPVGNELVEKIKNDNEKYIKEKINKVEPHNNFKHTSNSMPYFNFRRFK